MFSLILFYHCFRRVISLCPPQRSHALGFPRYVENELIAAKPANGLLLKEDSASDIDEGRILDTENSLNDTAVVDRDTY